MRATIIRTACLLSLIVLIGPLRSHSAAAPVQPRAYTWFGEFKALDAATKTATFTAQIPEHVGNYVGQFKAGDRLVLVWDMIGKTQADRVLALWKFEEKVDSGYILPIEFVSGDVPGHTVTFNLRVPDKGLSMLKDAKPGQWFKVTAPMEQPKPDAAILSMEPAERPHDPVKTQS
jgi:hypothetical protein